MTLSSGARLGPYEVLAAIGMGEAYKARDTRFDRSVAVNGREREVHSDNSRYW
jgi:hypothetical protein